MSSNLIAEPIVHSNEIYLDTSLKFAMRKRYDGHIDIVLTRDDVPYLSGLNDAGQKDAGKLLKLLDKHEEVRLWEHY